MKKKIIKYLGLALVVITMFSMCGCSFKQRTPTFEEREVGDFVVLFYEDYCEIKGTTEKGNEKQFLVIPEFIEGVPVTALGYHHLAMLFASFGNTTLAPPEIESEVLEKIFCEGSIRANSWLGNREKRPNLTKVFYPNANDIIFGDNGYVTYYLPRRIYEDGRPNERTFYASPANVSYYYNYENAETTEYYWIDDCDYGSKIEFIPPDPIREGYTFDGWYKESECINAWDFEVDTLPEEELEIKEGTFHINENGEREQVIGPVYQETILYAKWK